MKLIGDYTVTKDMIKLYYRGECKLCLTKLVLLD